MLKPNKYRQMFKGLLTPCKCGTDVTTTVELFKIYNLTLRGKTEKTCPQEHIRQGQHCMWASSRCTHHLISSSNPQISITLFVQYRSFINAIERDL